MTRWGRTLFNAVGLALGVALVTGGVAGAQSLTADEAVKLALANGSGAIGAEAAVLDARSGLYGAYSGVLPQVRGTLSRGLSKTEDQVSRELFGDFPSEFRVSEAERYTTTPALSGTWNVLDLSGLSSVRSARSGVQAARHQRAATRNDVVLGARRQFYEVVRRQQLAVVSSDALKLARDDERRVRALFEVGSVSRSDLLSAQVRTAQAELDSLTSHQAVTSQRIVLAGLLGLRESQMAPIDTLLAFDVQSFDEPALLAEATSRRPDLMAAEAEYNAAKSNVTAARLNRLPYVSVSGTGQFNATSDGNTVFEGDPPASTSSETDRFWSAQVALNWDLFDGLSTDSRNAAARARLLRARDARDVLRRNLGDEVHESLLAHREAIERREVAERAVESATENLKLTQQKYNVGASTILELIDAQVQLQRARSDMVSALVAIRVAEAAVEHVRGRGE